MDATEVVHFLSSKAWDIQRTIFDRNLGTLSTFAGSGSFAPNDSRWIYREHGELLNNGRTYSANRQYIYELRRNFLSVHFEDGRPFYVIDCGQLPETSIEHTCGLDKYVGNLTIGSQSWKNRWRVIGPVKNLEISSNYF